MTRRRLTWALALATSAGIGGALLRGAGALPGRAGSTMAAAEAAADEVELRTRDIAFFAGRAERDPSSAEDLAILSALYLQRARETGDVEDFGRAEAAARRSLALRTTRNDKTRLILGSILLALHRFPQARETAEQLVAEAPEVVPYRVLLAELQVEMGDYCPGRSGASDSRTGTSPRSRWRGNACERLRLRFGPVEPRWLPNTTSGEMPLPRYCLVNTRRAFQSGGWTTTPYSPTTCCATRSAAGILD